MKAMVISRLGPVTEGSRPLELVDLPRPEITENEVLIRVTACGVCHTELDEIEGRTPPLQLPIVPGHQIVGTVVEAGSGVTQVQPGDRVGVAWIFSACGRCEYCRSGNENLCPQFRATGRDAHGGYAEYTAVPARFVYPIPERFSDAQAAPLLCAGAIGYRSLRLANLRDGDRLGLTGFGASGHQVLKMARYLYPNSPVYVFTRSEPEQTFARELGADWAGGTADTPPQPLNAVIDTTPAWKPVVEGLRSLAPGGRLVINAIRKETADQDYLLNLDYSQHLWMEKEIKSVANITRRDVEEFLQLAARIPLSPEVQTYTLEQANQALVELKTRRIRGAKVIVL